MSSADRLGQLRELVGRLERLPVTEERDSVLRKVRARVVDVDTGVTTPQVAARTAVVVVDDPRVRPDVPRVARSGGRRSRPSECAPPRVGHAVAMGGSSDVLAVDRRLSLEDLEAPDATAFGTFGHRAWTRGLRG